MNQSTYPSDGYAAFAVDGHVRIVGVVKQGVPYSWASNVEPFFAETLDGLKDAIAAKGYARPS